MIIKSANAFLPEKLFGMETALFISFVPLGVLVGAVLVSLNLVVIPKYEEFALTINEVKNLSAKNQTIVEKTRYIQSIDPEELKKNSQLISAALLPQKNAYTLVGVIKAVAQKYNYQIESFSISPGKLDKDGEKTAAVSKGVSKIPIKASIVGPKAQYLEFIKGIERTLPVLTINNFKLSNQGSLVKIDLDIAASYIEDNSKFDINRLTLSDLTLKKEEMDLLATLNEYSSALAESASAQEAPQFTKYNREDPFTP